MRISVLLRSVFLLLLVPSLAFAQGWEKKYGSAIDHKGYYAHPTTDGGYIMAASSTNAVYGFYDDMKFIRTNALGDTLWTRTFSDVHVTNGRIMVQTRDGGFIMVGSEKSAGLLHLTKLKGDGSVEWRKTVASSWSNTNLALIYGRSLQQTSDGGFIIAGERCYVGGGTSDAALVKVNSKGELVWDRSFRIAWLRPNMAVAVEQTPDFGYILTGTSDDGGFIIKTDAWGSEVWKKNPHEFYFSDVKRAQDSGYVLVGRRYKYWPTTRPGAYFIKLRDNGDTLYTKYLGHYDSVTVSSIERTNDGGYCIAGSTIAGTSSREVLLIKTDKYGDTSWTRTTGDAWEDVGYSARQTGDGNYIMAGTTKGSDGKTRAYLIRTDKLGNVLTNMIAGSVFEEKNSNCGPDAGEKALANPAYWKVKVTPGDKWVVPDAAGNYAVRVDTGTYQVNVVNNHPYWQVACPTTSYPVSFDKFYDTASRKDFGLAVKTACPWMWIDVATAIVRPGRETVHTIRYCNNGTADATNAYLEFTLDPALTFVRSTIAPAAQNGPVLRFDLGTVKAGDCATLEVVTQVATTVVANSAVCVRAKIYPEDCQPPATGWDKSSVKVTGKCTGEGVVRFVIVNTGEAGGGDMQGTSQYRIYIDNALVETNTFQLKGGDSLVLQVSACGKTVRLEADQRPGHPGKSRPRETVEGCTGCGTAPASFGMRTAAAPDDWDEGVEEDCSIVRASFDPNEKLVIPAGITANQYVAPGEELEYRINFQNTGNDTAFLVVLKDTLDAAVLDIASLVPGVASHPYTFTMSGKGILEWRFDNILLPDSTTNEKRSHGFVKFRIRQVAGLANGTAIRNKAAIYFDYNAPVITDPSVVVVNDYVPRDRGDYNIVIVKEVSRDTTSSVIRIAPHPLVTASVIKVPSSQVGASGKWTFHLYDGAGRKVRGLSFTGPQAELSRGALKAGMYFWRITYRSKTLATGKLVVQ